METTIVCWGYIMRIMEKNMETTMRCRSLGFGGFGFSGLGFLAGSGFKGSGG